MSAIAISGLDIKKHDEPMECYSGAKLTNSSNILYA